MSWLVKVVAFFCFNKYDETVKDERSRPNSNRRQLETEAKKDRNRPFSNCGFMFPEGNVVDMQFLCRYSQVRNVFSLDSIDLLR